MLYDSRDGVNGDVEIAIRELIDKHDTKLLSSLAYLSIDFIREFRDKIDIDKMWKTLMNYPEPPVLTDQWYRWREKLYKFEKEFMKEEYRKQM